MIGTKSTVMIVVFYLQNMSKSSLGEFYESVKDFAVAKFDIKISDEGHVTIDGEPADGYSYSIGEDPRRHFTKEEALKDYLLKGSFLKYAKSKFYSVYKTTKII